MSSAKYCCVPGCPNMKIKPEGSILATHGFPDPVTDKDRFNTWLHAIGGDILDLSMERIHKYRRVCHLHFEENFCRSNNRITKTAIPTLNMPDARTKLMFSHAERRPMKEINDLLQPSTSKDLDLQHQNEGEAVRRKVLKTYSRKQKENIVPVIQSAEEVSLPTSSLTKGDEKTEKENKIVLQNPVPVIQSAEEVSLPTSSLTKGDEETDEENIIVLQNPVPVIQSAEEVSLPTSSLTKGDEKTEKVKKIVIKNPSNQEAKKRNRLVFLTEKERQLHTTITAAKVKICKLKNRVMRQTAELKQAKKMASDPSALKVIENCSSAAKLLMQIQWRENKKKEKGRRFTIKEKILALSILKQSPRAYKFLRKIFILPAPQTLIKLVQQSNIKPGINKNIFKQLQKRASAMKKVEKLCVLMFDEVSLKAQLTFNERKDKVTGFVDNGKERRPEFSDHAQVFMVRGLIKNFKQPVAYTFSSSATKGPELATQIKEIITELQQAGLFVVATVCDQGTNNCSALKILENETRGVFLRKGEDPKANTLLINDQEVIPLYDPPHLLKGMRNNLLTKDLKYTKENKVKTAKWSHLKLLYKENPGYKGNRLIPKLTESHINPERNKMKVKYAAQIFSRTVASNIGYLADKKILPEESKDTADFLLLMDNMFDSVNGSYSKNKHAKPLLGPATPTSIHVKTWRECRQILNTMKFVSPSGKEEVVPSIKNWVFTLNSIELLLTNLREKYGVTSVWLRHLNQDPLENFFGSIRSHGCRNNNPTCDQFESAFATLLVNNLSSVNIRGRNCEGDYCEVLYALVLEDIPKPALTCTIEFEKLINIAFTPLEEKEKDPRIIGPLQYVAGYFLKMIKQNVFKGCETCKKDFISDESIEYIQYREYAGQRWLCTPSSEMIKLVSNLQDIINIILKTELEKDLIAELIKTVCLTLIDFKFLKCENHKKRIIEYTMYIVVRFMMFHYVKNINKLLAGRRNDVDDDEDKFQTMAKKYNTKCMKRKK